VEQCDVKRLALVFAKQAEIDGMKAENTMCYWLQKTPKYTQVDFQMKVNDLENLAYAHDQQLFG
jgi:hypothetical protein